MPFSAESNKPAVSDQISELQRRIQLIEGDRTAFYESSQSTIKKNKETIQRLREENTRLYKKLAAANEGDKHVVKVAFHGLDQSSEKDAYRNMSGKTAMITIDQKIQSKKKRLNAQKHITKTLQNRLDYLKLEYETTKAPVRSATKVPDTRTQKREEDAMKLRTLENNLEKTVLKCKEAENITRNYLTLKSHLQDESLNFLGLLDSREADLLKHKEELINLQRMSHEAQLSAEASKAELQQREELLYRDRKERERYRTKVEENRIQAEKTERRVQRTAMQPDDLSSEIQRSTTRMAGEEEKAISTLEEFFQQIKEATEVTNAQEVADRVVAQKGIHEHLEKLMEENKTTLQQLKEQKELLTQQFQENKYSGEAELSRDQHVLEDCEQQLQAAQRRCDEAKDSLSALDKTLSTAEAGVEHLADKLKHISLRQQDTVTITDSRLVDLLAECEHKLLSLHTELHDQELSTIMKTMEDEEFFLKIEKILPTYNTRVLLPEDQGQEPFEDDEESDEDEAGTISREALKRQSQLIVDSKLKNKQWKKKK